MYVLFILITNQINLDFHFQEDIGNIHQIGLFLEFILTIEN